MQQLVAFAFTKHLWRLPAGDVLPGSVYHEEAAVRPDTTAHRALLPRCTGAGTRSGQLFGEGAAVRFHFFFSFFFFWFLSNTAQFLWPFFQLWWLKVCFSFSVLFAMITKNLVAVQNQGRTLFSDIDLNPSRTELLSSDFTLNWVMWFTPSGMRKWVHSRSLWCRFVHKFIHSDLLKGKSNLMNVQSLKIPYC